MSLRRTAAALLQAALAVFFVGLMQHVWAALGGGVAAVGVAGAVLGTVGVVLGSGGSGADVRRPRGY